MQYLHGVLDNDQVPQEDLSPRSSEGHLLFQSCWWSVGTWPPVLEGWMMSQGPLLTLQAPRLCPSVGFPSRTTGSEAGGRTPTHASGHQADSGQCPGRTPGPIPCPGWGTDFLVRSESAQSALRASLDTPRPARPWFHITGRGLVTQHVHRSHGTIAQVW